MMSSFGICGWILLGLACFHVIVQGKTLHDGAQLDVGGARDVRGDAKRDKTTHLDRMQTDMTQGDIKDQGHQGTSEGKDIHKRTMALEEDRRWTKMKVPYVITDALDEYYRGEVARGMRTYERFTCLRFLPWTNQSGVTTNEKFELGYEGYLKFVQDDGACRAPLGNRRAIYDVNCCSGYTCMHELGHSLGMTHEAPSPDRDGWMRVNYENIESRGKYFYEPYLKGEVLSIGYDYSSVMHYGTWGFSKGGPTFNFLFPELHTQDNYYYVTMEVNLAHKCQETACKDFTRTCENDGFATLVDGRCDCRCLPGLDPSTGCTTPMTTDPPGVSFPAGSYALPQVESGCPQSMQTGSRVHYSQGDNGMSSSYNLKGTVSGDKAEHHFCVSATTATEDSVKWTPGNYCIYKKGGKCPGGFSSGYVQYDDSPTSTNQNSKSGELPDGVFDDNTKFEFCCREDGFSPDEIFLPSRQPFALFKHPKHNCHAVRGMHVSNNQIIIGSSGAENIATVSGATPVTLKNGKLLTDVCYYKPAMINCGDIIELNNARPTVTFDTPSGEDLECVWLIKAPEGEGIVLNFPEFNVDCNDKVEIRHSRPGQPWDPICGTKWEKSTRSILNTMLVRISTFGNSQSSFKASVSLVSEENHCFKLQDHGLTYDGKVNFTRNVEPCLRWDEVKDCPHNAFNIKDQSVRMEENYCRTPDFVDGFRPWCYTARSGCVRNYCDVCLLENIVDNYEDCASLQAEGVCSDPEDSVRYCAKTCGVSKENTPVKAASVKCAYPGDVNNAVLTTPKKDSYGLGEKITYKCSVSSDTQSRSCLTSGNWSPLPQVCSECPQGWTKYEDNCYLYKNIAVEYLDAKDSCTKMGATVATFKTQEVQNFIRSLTVEVAGSSKDIWMGLNDDVTEGDWYWSDGQPLNSGDWTNWEAGEPNNWNNVQDCAVLTSYNQWNDLNCQWKYIGVVCQKPTLDVSSVTECRDVLDTCDRLFENNPQMCGEHSEFVKTYCLYTCGLCNEGSFSLCTVDAPNDHVTKVGTATSLRRGEVVEYACDSGYVASNGNTHRGCTSTGSLTGQPLVCIALAESDTVVNSHPFFYSGGTGYWGTSYTGANENFRIPRAGEVKRWEFYSGHVGTVAFQVWRHHPEKGAFEFEFIGQNEYQTPEKLEWKLEVPANERIKVKAGDYIGIWYRYWGARGGVLYEKCSDDPKANNIVWNDTFHSLDTVKNGTIYSFDPSTSCRYFTFRAIVGPES